MGTNLGSLLESETITLSDLSNRVIAIDAFNSIYAFLAIIRLHDGSPLTDREGRVTSHLSGLFNRNIRLLTNGVKPVYIFDGEPPKLKTEENTRRRERRQVAYERWKQAKAEGRTDDALKAAKESSMISSEMVVESKTLLQAMGIPVVQAPSEGEAVAAQMVQEDIAWGAASQDNDLLLYNCPRMVRNLVGRRTPKSRTDNRIPLEFINLHDNLERLTISREQLIDIAILIGTDYNDKIPGVGPKTAIKLLRKYGSLEEIEKSGKYMLDFPYSEIREIFLNPPPYKISDLEFSSPDDEAIRKILCDEYDFNTKRIDSSLHRLQSALEKAQDDTRQSSLTDYF